MWMIRIQMRDRVVPEKHHIQMQCECARIETKSSFLVKFFIEIKVKRMNDMI